MPNPWGNEKLSSKSKQGLFLRDVMKTFHPGKIPAPSQWHRAHKDFIKFDHKSFSNVYQNIKKNILSSNQSVADSPGIDCDDEDEGECVVLRVSVAL